MRTRPTSYLIDSGILIFVLRRDLRAFRLMRALTQRGPVETSAVTAFELLRGRKSQKQELIVENLLSSLGIIPVDMRCARHAAALFRIYPGVFSSGQTVPDALIAGCAIEARSTLVTLNRRQFREIGYPGLEVMVIDQEASDWAPALA